MLQRDSARRPSVNEILSRQLFKDMAKRWLDEDVHADEFSTPSYTASRARETPRGRRIQTQNRRRRREALAAEVEARAYPSGGEGVPTANQQPPSTPAARPTPSRGGD